MIGKTDELIQQVVKFAEDQKVPRVRHWNIRQAIERIERRQVAVERDTKGAPTLLAIYQQAAEIEAAVVDL